MKQVDHLVVGGDGQLGRALCQALHGEEWFRTSRRRHAESLGRTWFYDFLASDPRGLPPTKFVYLVAAITKFAECACNPEAWRVNVDGPIAVARRYVGQAHIVFISSDAVERCNGEAYARQKAHAESVMQALGALIVRPKRLTADNIDACAAAIVEAAKAGRSGVLRWP